MDTTTSTSSSSAALRDSASAAASSKSTSTGVAVSATSVKLLIKASNQQFDDHIIESDLLWTVKRLKTQLSVVYPSKPAVADQKLIYSGQLLQDALLLKDVIRSYKDVYTHNHIFHLVYTSKNVPPPQKPKVNATVAPKMSTNPDGLRQRHVAGAHQHQPQQSSESSSLQQQPQPQQQQFTAQFASLPLQFAPQWMAAQFASSGAHAVQAYPQTIDPNGSGNPMLPFSLPGQFNMQALASQQAMYNWMQHVYSQYMDQCMQLSNATAGIPHVSPTGANATGVSGVSSSNIIGNSSSSSAGFPPNPFLQQLPFLTPNAAMPTTTPVIPAFHPSAPGAAVAAPAAADQPQAHLQEEQPQQQQEPVAAQRFPNIVQDEQDNRDWLDSFFSITRLAIFLTILYFNSSPLRCLVVVMIAGGIYLYHIGVLRLRLERNNNNINRNNNAAVADQIRQGVQRVQAAQQQQQEQQQGDEANPLNLANDAAAGAATEPLLPSAGANSSADAVEEGEDNNSHSVVSFVRTFVVTFFTSLLPETPAL